ncbi:Aste57867_19230 [Aphanomyces stellatus]|uniref:Aste57867_15747 protein n=1 Tax=Aphanomyces stellatus TaxID=120398 RepID=A0A485L4T5_9STRA|nr:hypothetical protein As57867_019166 [Aphanomyces stellatus]KAF0693270.1 hypothetical protein As57867_015691 [Aphanomyces stellatus]VFT92536.1 Aste57867_15747 [Aphanomyces stellatus]VFT95951.1 Aste57867_19230 [Aphanomyces stellatus]
MQWPSDLIEAIIRFISDPNDLFHFLTALEPTKSLGNLSHLLQLLRIADSNKHCVWPWLVITPSTVVDLNLRASVKYYDHIELNMGHADSVAAFDLTWLDVAPPTAVYLVAYSEGHSVEASAAWCNHLSTLPITHISLRRYICDTVHPAWLNIFPRLQHLTSVILCNVAVAITPFLAFVSTSKLTDLHFVSNSTEEDNIHDLSLVHLTKWLETQPVHSFSWLDKGAIAFSSNIVVQAFLCAVSQLTTLTSFTTNWLTMEDVRYHALKLPQALQSLQINDLRIHTSDDAVTLDALLTTSNVTDLSIPDADLSDQFVLECLPKWPLRRLAMPRALFLTYRACHLLGQILPHTSIVRLDLSNNILFGNQGPLVLAACLAASSVQELCLNDCNLHEATVLALIDVAASTPRLSISLIGNNLNHQQEVELVNLAQQRGCQVTMF